MAVSTGGEPINALRIKPTKKTANNKVSARERSVRSSKWGFRLVSLIRACVPVSRYVERDAFWLKYAW